MSGIPTTKLKRKFMMMIAEDETTFKTIDNEHAEYPDDLFGVIGTNNTPGCPQSIFPQIKVDFTEQQAGTYIGIKIDYPSICKNELYKDYILTIMIISHTSHLKAPNGSSRTDIIAESLTHLFNWNNTIEFPLELISDVEDPLDSKHYFRKLRFKSLTANSMFNGVKKYD